MKAGMERKIVILEGIQRYCEALILKADIKELILSVITSKARNMDW